MPYTLNKYEMETVILYNQSTAPILIDTYDPPLRRRLAEYAENILICAAGQINGNTPITLSTKSARTAYLSACCHQ